MMHRIEIKAKDGKTYYVGTMSSIELASQIIKGIWVNGTYIKELNRSILPHEIDTVHMTSYARGIDK